MSNDIDTTATLEIEQSPIKLIAMLIVAIAFTALCAYFSMKASFNDKPLTVVFPFGAIFFGAGGLVILSRFMKLNDAAITISPEGIRDTRVAARTIPWNVIHSISTWSSGSQKCMVLAVDPDAEKALSLTRNTRWSRMANKAVGADGLVINTIGLDISYDQFLRITLAYAEAAGQKRASA